MRSVDTVPELVGDARGAALYRGGHLQLIASAGAGKTEVVAHRVANLVVEGVAPREIVAFTFTERAAAELKARMDRRAAALAGEGVLDRIGTMFVGTIHSYAFRLLHERVRGGQPDGRGTAITGAAGAQRRPAGRMMRLLARRGVSSRARMLNTIQSKALVS